MRKVLAILIIFLMTFGNIFQMSNVYSSDNYVYEDEGEGKFIFTINTDGQVTIPTIGDGYDYTIEWGDGGKDENQTGDANHNYAKLGKYEIRISGKFPRIHFGKRMRKDFSYIEEKVLVKPDKGVRKKPDGTLSSVGRRYSNFGSRMKPGKLVSTPPQKLDTVLTGNLLPNNFFSEANNRKRLGLSKKALEFLGFFDEEHRGGYKYLDNSLEIKQWGNIEFESMEGAFYGVNEVIGKYSDVPKTEKLTSMKDMFKFVKYLDFSFEGWNTSNVVDMSSMFEGVGEFAKNLSGLDTTNVKNMSSMFEGVENFNQSLAHFNTEKVENMASMFFGAKNFNQSLANFNTENVVDMSFMFGDAENFNQSLANFNTEKVKNIAGMFSSAKDFNQSLANFNTENVVDMSFMFKGAENFNGSLANFNTEKVENMVGMFFGAKNFNQSLSNFNTENVVNMNSMFKGAEKFNQSLASFNTSNVIDMGTMFEGAKEFNGSLENFNTEKVENMYSMFKGAKNFNQSLASFNTERVKFMASMFEGARSFNQSLSNFNTLNILDMSSMFEGAEKFNQSLANFETSNVENMTSMFSGAENFNQDLSSWNTSNLLDMNFMFSGAKSFNGDISSFNTEGVSEMIGVFSGAEKFNQPIENFNFDEVYNSSYMFSGAKSFNQDISNMNLIYMLAPNRGKPNYESMINMFQGVKLSRDNYEKFLIKISELEDLPSGIHFDGGYSTYCSSESKQARRSLIEKYLWIINDGGESCLGKDIIHSSPEIPENSLFAGNFSIKDDNTSEYNYSFVNGEGSDDNDKFNLTSYGALSFKNSPDFENPLDNDKDNIYKIRLKVRDNVYETSEKDFLIKVTDIDETKGAIQINNDSTKPIIKINGEKIKNIELGQTYVDDGAICEDDSGNCEIKTTGEVIIDKIGTYPIVYTAKDASGNTESIVRVVNVIDSSKPIIKINGENLKTIEVGQNYLEEGAICEDNSGKCEIETSGEVDTTKAGVYRIKYTAKDEGNNTSFLERIINVVEPKITNIMDSIKPTININGENTKTIELGEEYLEEGATCEDDSGECEVKITGEVNTKKVGVYKIIYTAKDKSNNETVKERMINVVDNINPIIKINGEANEEIEIGQKYLEKGATCEDLSGCDVEINGMVNSNKLGTYEIIYIAKDKSGNISEKIKRTVTVKEKVTNSGSGNSGNSSGGNFLNGSSPGFFKIEDDKRVTVYQVQPEIKEEKNDKENKVEKITISEEVKEIEISKTEKKETELIAKSFRKNFEDKKIKEYEGENKISPEVELEGFELNSAPIKVKMLPKTGLNEILIFILSLFVTGLLYFISINKTIGRNIIKKFYI